jgi:two-component system, LytTR family, response regulator
LQQLMIREGRNMVFIPIKDVQFLQSSSPYLKVQLAGRHYLHMETLRSMALKLDPTAFVQVHKSTIVRRDAVREMKSRANGDYDLILENGQQVRLSRRYVAAFKASSADPIFPSA